MSTKFSVIPPPFGTEGDLSTNILGVPKIESIFNFFDGNLGIADNIKKNTILKSIKYSKLNSEAMDIYLKNNNVKLEKPLDSYKKIDTFDIPTSDMIIESNNEKLGLHALEKTIFNSVLETQKPYIEVAKKTLDIVAVAEDIVAVILSGYAPPSLKPKYNTKSLTYKLSNITDDLNKVKSITDDKSTIFDDIDDDAKKTGISLDTIIDKSNSSTTVTNLSSDNFVWEIISIDYSTNEFIPFVNYVYEYRDIVDEKPDANLDVANDNINLEREIPDEIIVCVFERKLDLESNSVYYEKVDLNNVTTDVGLTSNFFGNFNQYNYNNYTSEFHLFVDEFTEDKVRKKYPNKDVDLSEITNMIKNSVPEIIEYEDENGDTKQEEYKNMVRDNSVMTNYSKDSDSNFALWIKTNNNRKMPFQPMVINYDGEDVYIDPESDYDLTIEERNIEGNDYYIVRSKTDEESHSDNGGGLDLSEFLKYYLYKVPKNIIRASIKFVEFLIKIGVELVITAKDAISLLSSPHNFILSVLLQKLGENFDMFSEDVMRKFNELSNITDKIELKKYIREDIDLKKYIHVDDLGNYRFIFDGVGTIPLMGFDFGIGLNNLIPNFIIDKNSSDNPPCQDVPPNRNVNSVDEYLDNFGKYNLTSGTSNDNTTLLDNNNNITWEIINVDYSTGNLIEGINYEYYYITQEIQQDINKGDEFLNELLITEDTSSKQSLALNALKHYNKALSKEPNNRYIKKQIDEVKKGSNIQPNMIIQMLMSIISTPIKIVVCIINYVIDFFTNLNVVELPKKIVDFLSFNWILQFVSPTKIVELTGILFDPAKLTNWLRKLPNLNDDYKFDLSQIFSAPFIFKLPIVNKEQLIIILTQGGNKILKMMTSVFTLFEEVLNSIIQFIFDMFNIGVLFPPPKLKLSQFSSESMTEEELEILLKQLDQSFTYLEQGNTEKYNQSVEEITKPFYVYNIQLNDGTIISDLNSDEVDKFIAENSNIKFNFI